MSNETSSISIERASHLGSSPEHNTTHQTRNGDFSFATPFNEEVAGPVSGLAPTTLSDRISCIDVLRGVALLGILVLNIDDFGNPEIVHDFPIGTPINNFTGPHFHLNLALLMIKWMFFEGKMRGLFSMLFGAGVILLTSRAERRGSTNVADIYTRRNLSLLIFGVLHTCLIWHGDILFDYGFVALLFLYPARKLKAKTLLWFGTFLSLFIATFGVLLYFGGTRDYGMSQQAAAIQARQEAGSPVTVAEKGLLVQWHDRIESQRITPQKTDEAFKEGTLDYPASVLARAQGCFQDGFHILHIDLMADFLSAMLIGMGLMKLGFFSAELSYGTYIIIALTGFAVSVPIYAVGVLKAYASGFYFLEMEKWVWLPYYLTREAGSIAIAASVILFVKSGVLRLPQRLLADVGKTAFSNYILTSLLCQTLFIWGPWKLYAKLEYYQLMYVVFGVWTLNLTISTLWLKRFAFGPLEWMWRSLTYGAVQPLRLREPHTNSGARTHFSAQL